MAGAILAPALAGCTSIENGTALPVPGVVIESPTPTNTCQAIDIDRWRPPLESPGYFEHVAQVLDVSVGAIENGRYGQAVCEHPTYPGEILQVNGLGSLVANNICYQVRREIPEEPVPLCPTLATD